MEQETTGRTAADGAGLDREVDRRLAWAGMGGNGLGGVIVFVYLGFLGPVAVDQDDLTRLTIVNVVCGALYLGVTLPLGLVLSRRRYATISRWLRADRPPTEAERSQTLRFPLHVSVAVSALFWVTAAVMLGLLNLFLGSLDLALVIGITIAFGGVTTCAVTYLLVERILRPVVALALAEGPPDRPVTPGVAARLTMAWTLGTAVPLLGLMAIAVADLSGADLFSKDARTLAGGALFLSALAIGVGFLALILAARSVADPIAAVRDAAARIERGDLEARVAVQDGSEVGMLGAGFNRMAAGLAERERLREAFGRQVGREVARAAIDGEVRLGGEVREAAILFIDLVGSTSLAARRPPTEVVALLNAFFRLVVGVVERHGGWVNKFQGDAALCVFGVPADEPDAAERSLRAARDLRSVLGEELPELDSGIGVSAGEVVAGYVGAEERFEYTVIGDPVNEAARLCELAKRRPERMLASEAALSRAGEGEAGLWRLGESVVLRGRDSATRVAVTAAS